VFPQLLDRDVERRLGSKGGEEVRAHRYFEGMDWEGVMAKRLPPPILPETDAATEALSSLPQPALLRPGRKKKQDNR
jgi:hypothetical protein